MLSRLNLMFTLSPFADGIFLNVDAYVDLNNLFVLVVGIRFSNWSESSCNRFGLI